MLVTDNFKIYIFKIGQVIKIECRDLQWKRGKSKTFEGDIIFKNNRYITIKGDNYKESFTMEQFKRGEVKLLNV